MFNCKVIYDNNLLNGDKSELQHLHTIDFSQEEFYIVVLI